MKTQNSGDLSNMLKSNIFLTNPNEKVIIHDGNVTFINNSGKVNLHGKLLFIWFPNMAVRFYGSFSKDSQIKDFSFFDTNPKIVIENNTEEFDLNGLSLALNEAKDAIDIM
jgi:hypothetical protein